MFQTLVVPVDDAASSLRAVAAAVHLAERLAAKIVLVHVVEPLPLYTTQVEMHLPEGELERAQLETARATLETFRARVPEGVDLQAVVHRGKGRVWRDILDAAGERGADLIVMGTHGREGVARALLGSVAERVAHHAEVPVMLVR